MIETFLYGLAGFLISLVGGLVVVRYMLHAYDRIAGFDFKGEIAKEISSGNTSVGLYFGLRFLGVCILASAIAGKFW